MCRSKSSPPISQPRKNKESAMSSKQLSRRHILQSAAAMGLLGLSGCATTSIPQRAKVVVVGGG
jgi:hypothetical protein